MTTARRKKKHRSRTIPATFAPGFLNQLDQRFASSLAARRSFDELAASLGGAENLTPQRRLLVERVVWVHLMLEQAEYAFATTTKVDSNSYGQLVHVLVSLLKTLGLNRAALNVPTLRDYMEGSKGA